MKRDKGHTNKEIRTLKVTELRVKRAEGEDPVIEGYAVVYNSWSEDLGGFIERIKPGAATNALKVSDVRALKNHNSDYVLGRQSSGTLELKEDKKGLFMSVNPPDTQWARDLQVSIDRGDITEQSFGFTIKEDSWREGEKGAPDERTILEFNEIFDVSPVTYPAYPDTSVALRSLEEYKKTCDTAGNESDTAFDNENLEIDTTLINLNTRGLL